MRDVAATLIGHVRPIPSQPGFPLLIFQAPHTNWRLAQQHGPNGEVVEFRRVDPVEVLPIERSLVVRIGEPALWCYAFPDEAPTIGGRDAVIASLIDRLGEIRNPLLRLEAATFCGHDKEEQDGWRAAFSHLGQLAPRSAVAWRDLVVLPREVRSVVARAIRKHGLEERSLHLGRDVSIHIDADQMHVEIEPALLAKLNDRGAALHEIERGTKRIRTAFGLSSKMWIEPQDAPPPDDHHEDMGVRPLIVAFGDRGVSVANKLLPERARRRPQAASGGRALFGKAPYGPEPILIIDMADKAVWIDVSVESLGPHLPPPVAGSRRPIVFVFGASAQEGEIVDQVLRLARSFDPKGYRIVAAIPHLPDAAWARDAKAYSHLLTGLSEVFGAVCLLSDQSPHSGGGLALGPARSIDAAAGRLRTLADLLENGDHALSKAKLRIRDGALRVSVFTSVKDSGGLREQRLLEHALARAVDFSLDWRDNSSVTAEFSGNFAGTEVSNIDGVLDRAGIGRVKAVRLQAGASRHAQRICRAHLADVHWKAAWIGDFEPYCRSVLERHGWLVSDPDLDHANALLLRSGQRIYADFKAYGVADVERPQRARERSRADPPIIRITDATIHRADFIRHVLEERMPLHFSRIHALGQIYAQRYRYVLRSLRKGSENFHKSIAEAAYAHVIAASPGEHRSRRNARGLDMTGGAGRLSVQLHRTSIDVSTDHLTVDLSLSADVLSDAEPDLRVRAILAPTGWMLASGSRL